MSETVTSKMNATGRPAPAPGTEPRQLIYIPIVHETADMGSQAERLRQVYVERYGEQAWTESRKAVAAFWERVEKEIDELHLDYRKVRLYQDGLPLCGREADIVRDVAAQGSNNYRILLDLMGKGAVLEGTEDPALLLKEYALIKAAASTEAEAGDKARRLLEQRDRFIAARIDATLRSGETGMLFMGTLHQVREVLPESIAVRQLIEV